MSAGEILIRGAQIVRSEEVFGADILIKDGRIADIGQIREGETVLDARGLTALPALIDTQVHFREPGLTHKEDLESGTRAALHGGVGTILEMPNTVPPTTTQSALDDKLQRAQGRAWCDYGFFVGASAENAEQLSALENAPGSPGIKVFMGSSTGSLLVEEDSVLEGVMWSGKRRFAVHAEDEARLRERKHLAEEAGDPAAHPIWRDAAAARIATERILRLIEKTGRPGHILHVSTLDELPLLAEAKRHGLPVTCEVTPQHLALDATAYESLGTKAQMNPPLRSGEHREALWKAVSAGLFDVFGSDHAPHTLEEKQKPYPASPSGMPGVQTMLPLLLTWAREGRIALQDIARMGAENAAALYGIRGKGRLAEGFDADVVLVDLDKEWTIDRHWLQSKCGWSPFEGWCVRGTIEHVFLRGQWVIRDGQRLGEPKGRPALYTWK